VSLDAPAILTFTAAFTSQNPVDAQDPRDFQVRVSGAPAGWTTQVEPANFQLASGDSQTITVTVSVSAQAAHDSAIITATVRMAARGADPLPVLGEILDPEIEESATASITRSESVTREVLETLSHWIWFVLVGVLVLLVIVGKFAADARRVYVRLHVERTQVRVAPGKSVAVPVRVENLGKHEDTVVFHVATVGEGWSATLPVPDLVLDGGAREDLQLIIAAPKSARLGDMQNIGISAHSAAAPRRVAEAIVQVTVE
jgi:hypothetical protein